MTEASEKRRVSLLGNAGSTSEASEAAADGSMTSVMASYSASNSSGGASTTPAGTTSITVTSAIPSGGGGGGGKTPFIANADSRSVSVASVSSEGSNGSAHVSAKDPESAGGGSATGSGSGNERSAEMISLTRDIKEFKEAMRKLRRVFNPDAEPTETKRVACHERLGEVLAILRTMLENYPLLQSNHLVQSARHLISQVKDIGVLEDEVDEAEFHRALESLAWAFTQRVSQYLTAGEGNSSLANDPEGRERLENYHFQDFGLGELPPHTSPHFFRGPGVGGGGADELMTTDQIDNILMRQSQGVDYALKCAKNWEKYAKDLMNYVEKRIKLEVDWARNLTLLAQTMRPILKEESYLPFQSIYCTALDNDLEMCAATQETSRFLKGYRFLEPLSTRRSEHQKQRKILKDRWSKELKLMHDSASNLRKAQALYIERNRDYERCREAARIAEQGAELGATGENKVDKRKRLADEALAKTVESENYCKQCVIEANERHRQLLVVKREVLAKIRELILQCDQTMKSVTVSYFQLQHTLTSPVPTQFETLREQSRLYEPGTQFMEYVRTTLGDLPSSPRLTTSDPFNFEPEEHAPLYFDSSRSAHQSMPPRKSSATNDTTDGDYGSGTYKWRGDKSSRNTAAGDGQMPGWAPGMGPIEPSDDTDSVDSSPGSYSKSRDTSPSASPMVPSRRLPHGVASAEDIDESDLATAVSGVSISNAGSSSAPAQAPSGHSGPSAASGSSGGGAVPRRVANSVAGRTHRFRKTRAPAKCRECESYITIFRGVDCQECGMSVHRKCLDSIALVCGHKRLPRKTVTFGVDLGQHLLEVGAHVPPIVCKCVYELDKRGTRLEGIYRKSAVKHKIDKLCQNFEAAPELVELTDVPPFVISDVLKTYLRELPEPLISSKLYNDFIKVARQYPAPPMSLDGKTEEREDQGADDEQKVKEEAMIQEMGDLIRQLPRHHLRTLGFLIHHLARIAKESEENNMPASNLAIVFGPALMRAPTLSDTELQNRAVELMILHATAIFGTPDSVLPKDYARYTAGINYGGGGGGGSGSAGTGGGGGNSSSSDIPERRSVDSTAAAKQFSDPMWMLPGHVASTDDHGGLGAGEEYITDDDDDVGAIPSNWLPDDSAKTKKSPLLIRTEPPPKIIRQTLKTFSGLEGVTPERLSTQDSMETSQQRLSKQSSADVGAMASSTSNNCISTSTSGTSSKGGPSSAGGNGAGSGPRKSIPHGHESKHHQSLFAKMGKAAQKHSLDEDRLSPPAASASTSLATSAGGSGHAQLSERLSGGDVAASPSARDNESMLPGGGSTSTVIKSSTSPGSGRSSLTIHTIGNRSASLSEEHHHSAPITSSMTSSSSSSTVAEQRRKFLAGSNMTSSEGNSTATSSHHIRSTSSASSSTNVVGKMSSSLPTSIPNLDENRVKIQISASGVTGTTSAVSGQRSSTSQQRTPIVKQTSVDKTSNL